MKAAATITATNTGEHLYSLSQICAMTQHGAGDVQRALKFLDKHPAGFFNEQPYFAAASVDAVAKRFRDLETEAKAKADAAAAEAARPRTLKELLAERRKITTNLKHAASNSWAFGPPERLQEQLDALDNQIEQLAMKGQV